jgi:hypothetical protein
MFSPLHGSKIFQVSLVLSALSISDWLVCILIGTIPGLGKSLIVTTVAYFTKPSLRWLIIVGSTIILTLLEGRLYPNFSQRFSEKLVCLTQQAFLEKLRQKHSVIWVIRQNPYLAWV